MYVHRYICAHGYIIKKRMKIDVSFYTILQILRLIIFE